LIAHDTASAKDFTELARRAEGAGISTLLVPDHFIDHQLAPTVALAHAAAVTDTLRIGPLVLGNDYKHPVVLAREAGTLDLLSDGRLELGIGGLDDRRLREGRPAPRSPRRAHRGSRSRSHPQVCSPTAVPFHGEHYRVSELDGQRSWSAAASAVHRRRRRLRSPPPPRASADRRRQR
jgi:alkanesulfonate monooxygenase SsuD/methylene tetrahydromethanopterin reductase-like flavin-dependent oxidoreductase (luciferase family)